MGFIDEGQHWVAEIGGLILMLLSIVGFPIKFWEFFLYQIFQFLNILLF